MFWWKGYRLFVRLFVFLSIFPFAKPGCLGYTLSVTSWAPAQNLVFSLENLKARQMCLYGYGSLGTLLNTQAFSL